MDPWVLAVLLMGLGIGLAILEVFFPSAGLFGVLSAAAVVGSVIMAFRQGPLAGIISVLVAGAGLPTIIVLAFKYWPHTAMGRRMLLIAPTSEEVLPDDPNKERLKALVGRTGVAKTKLLLSGMVTIDGQNVDAVSESMPIEVGQAIRVVRVQSNRVVVRILEEPPPKQRVDPLQQTYEDPFGQSSDPPA